MEDCSAKTTSSTWTQLLTAAKEVGSQFTSNSTRIFELKLGRSEDNDTSSRNLLDANESTAQRSYGSLLTVPKPENIRGRNGRRRQSDSVDPFETSFEQLPPSYHESTYPSTRTSTMPKSKPNNVAIPLINVTQDTDFLTVDTSFPTMGGSSGFHSGPASPTPSYSGSNFEFNNHDFHKPEKFSIGRNIKIGLIVLIFLGCAAFITLTSEKEISYRQITSAADEPFYFPLRISPMLTHFYPLLTISVKGAFVPKEYENFTTKRLTIDIEQKDADDNIVAVSKEKFEIPIFSERVVGLVPETTLTYHFDLEKLNFYGNSSEYIFIRSNTSERFPLRVSIRFVSEIVQNGAVYGGAVIVGLYILIVFELVNRTLSAMLAATAAIGILAMFNERPTTLEMVSWLDMETLILLFSMMVIVSMLCETGFFDYCAYFMYKMANGKVWPLITGLCFFAGFVSAFLDNVTTILLMTPVTIRICEAMELNPVPVLISIVMFSNIGGAITPVGDPPNVIISNNPEVIKAGIDFAQFSAHMLLGIIPVMLVAYLQLRLMFRDMKSLQFSEPYAVAELRREIEVWLRAADSLSSYSKDESHVRALLVSKVVHLKNKLKVKIKMGGVSEEDYKANLAELEASCRVRDWPLLIKCGVVLFVVIVLFFLHSVPELKLSLGWTALLGTVFLLILADRKELEGIFTRVEWSTLIFFSALFIVMEAVSKLGLLEWIGNQTEEIILNVNPESRLTVAVVLILWVSGLASAFIDNIPFTTMMVQIVTRVASSVGLPLQPLVWALAFGTCLGGNGTLIGASANVVCAGVADQHGYRFTFMEYFKIGFPMMIVSLIVSTAYLVLCHTLLGWNY